MAKCITITVDVFCQNTCYQVPLTHTWQWHQFGFGGFCFYKCCTPELQYQEFFGRGGCSWLLFNKRLQFALICMVVVTFSCGLEQLHFSDFVLPFILYKMKTASEWIVVWITYTICEVSIQYQVSMKSAVDNTVVWEPMSKGTVVKVQVGSESVLRNVRK